MPRLVRRWMAADRPMRAVVSGGKSPTISGTIKATVVFSGMASQASPRRSGPAIEYLAQHGWQVNLVETRAPGDAAALAHEAVHRGDDVVIAAGGDGTVNEVVQALAHTGVALGVLPLGLENIWAKEIGVGSDPVAAAEALIDGELRWVDLGQALQLRPDGWKPEHRYFLMMASLGFDSLVVRKVTRSSKMRLGPLAYVLAGLGALTSFRGVELSVSLPDRLLRRRALLVVVGNSRLYAGRVRISSEAYVDDGLLDVCLFNERGLLSLRYPGDVVVGRHRQTPGVEYFRTSELTIDAHPKWPVQADGDEIGTTPMHFKVMPKALRVIAPRGANIAIFRESQPVRGCCRS